MSCDCEPVESTNGETERCSTIGGKQCLLLGLGALDGSSYECIKKNCFLKVVLNAPDSRMGSAS